MHGRTTPALFILCDLLLFAVLVIYVASASDHIIFTCSLRLPFWRNARFTEIRPLLLFVTRSPGHPPIFCQRCIEFSRQRSIEFSYQRCIELIHPARTRGGTSAGHIRCRASNRIRVPARPAQHVHKGVSKQVTPGAPKRSYHRRRYTEHDQRTRCRGSSGSASLAPNSRAAR